MPANDMLEYGDKTTNAYKDGTFSAYDYVLKEVSKFIQINLSLFN